jgi:hypothetical protein
VGPASGPLRGVEPSTWAPRTVALTVLADRSTARVTTGQRVSLSSVESAAAEQRDGQTYYVYEHVAQVRCAVLCCLLWRVHSCAALSPVLLCARALPLLRCVALCSVLLPPCSAPCAVPWPGGRLQRQVPWPGESGLPAPITLAARPSTHPHPSVHTHAHAQGSATIASKARETYRHSLAVSGVRPGLGGEPFIYTLNVSCPEARWGALRGAIEASVAGFRLTPPGGEYVAPDQDSWCARAVHEDVA